MSFKENPTIAVIDSGIGGISILRQLIHKFKCGNYIYYADNFNMPYGNKPKTFIKNRVEELIEMLLNDYHVSCVIVACNTASTSIDISKYNNVHIITFEQDVTYLTTPLTKSNISSKMVIADNTLAKEIESNIGDVNKLTKIVISHINALNLSDLKYLCLGCTHYELVHDIFQKHMPNTEIIDNSAALVNNIKVEKTNDFNILFLMSKYSKQYLNKLIKTTFS